MRIQTRKKLIAAVTLGLLTLQSFPLVAFGATTNDILQAIIAKEEAKSEEQKKILKYIGEKTGFTRGINNLIANEKANWEKQKKVFKYIGEKTGIIKGSTENATLLKMNGPINGKAKYLGAKRGKDNVKSVGNYLKSVTSFGKTAAINLKNDAVKAFTSTLKIIK